MYCMATKLTNTLYSELIAITQYLQLIVCVYKIQHIYYFNFYLMDYMFHIDLYIICEHDNDCRTQSL